MSLLDFIASEFRVDGQKVEPSINKTMWRRVRKTMKNYNCRIDEAIKVVILLQLHEGRANK